MLSFVSSCRGDTPPAKSTRAPHRSSVAACPSILRHVVRYGGEMPIRGKLPLHLATGKLLSFIAIGPQAAQEER